MHARTLAITLSACLAAAGTAIAADRPIGGLQLRITRDAHGTERLLFLSRDALLVPALGSPDDPTSGSPGGATVELFSQSTTGAVSFSAPRDLDDPGWWTRQHGYGFRHRAAPDPDSALWSIQLHASRGMRVVGRRAGLLLDGHEGRVGIRITTGEIQHCALFEPGTVLRDEPGAFHAKGAPASALTDCSDASLSPPPPPPPPPPTADCGDGLIDPDSESCDGAALGICGEFGASCGEPGFSNQCQCCSKNGELVSLLGCCNPSSVAIPTPAGDGFCFPLRCDAPFTCGARSECLPSGDCCGQLDNPCEFTLTGTALQPCCDGLVCGRPDVSGFFLSCCVPPGGSCAQDADCCSQSCSGSGTCD